MALLTLSMLAAAGAGYALDTLWRSGSPDAAWRLVAPKASGSPVLQASRLAQPLTLLVVVCDEAYEARGGAKVLGLRGRAEGMLLLRLDPTHQAVRGLAIPGATLVEGVALASTHSSLGVEALRKALSELLGQPIERHLVLNVQGAAQLLDALGGVPVEVPQAMDYEDQAAGWSVHLPPGRRTLRGEEAVGYLRYRGPKAGPMDELARVQRQQAFLTTTLDAFVAPINWPKAPQLLAIARRNLSTDLPPEEVVGISLWAKDLPRAAFTLANLPGRQGRDLRGRWAWLPEAQGAKALAARLLAEAPFPPPDPAVARLSLVDRSGEAAMAQDAFTALISSGWRNTQRLQAPSAPPLARTRVVVGNGDQALGQALIQTLGLGDLVVDGSGDPGAELTLEVGRDWAQRRRDAERPSPLPSPSLAPVPPSPEGSLEAPVPMEAPSPRPSSPARRPSPRPSAPPPSPWSAPSPLAIVGPSPAATAKPSPRLVPSAAPTPRPTAPSTPTPVAPVPAEPSPAEGPRDPAPPAEPQSPPEVPAEAPTGTP